MPQINYDFEYDERMKKGKKDLTILGGYSLKMSILYLVLLLSDLIFGWIALPLNLWRSSISLLLSLIPGFLICYNMLLKRTSGIFMEPRLLRRHLGTLIITYIILLCGSLSFVFKADYFILIIILIIISLLIIRELAKYHVEVTYWSTKKDYEEEQEAPYI
jgi:hypothetical protein